MNDFFLQIVFIIVAARVFGEIATRLSIPAVIGELLAGIILGPSLFKLIEPTETIHLLAEIGVVLLLFEIGLETNFINLLRVGGRATLAALAGIVVPFALGFFIASSLFKQETILSLFIGGTLTATSIGVTLRVMSELGKQRSSESQIILGAAIIDDLVGIVLLSILFEFSATGHIDFLNTGRVFLFIIIFLLIAPFLVQGVAGCIRKYEKMSSIPGLLPSSIISLILFFAWLARRFDAPELMGGFAAGIALSKGFFKSDEQFSTRVDHTLKPIIHLFVPIFFVNIGLNLNLHEIAWSSQFIWIFTGAILLVAIVGKLSSGFVLFNESRLMKWIIGLAMIPRGEVGLVFADVGRSNGIFNQEVYAGMTLVIALTTLLAPMALRKAYSTR